MWRVARVATVAGNRAVIMRRDWARVDSRHLAVVARRGKFGQPEEIEVRPLQFPPEEWQAKKVLLLLLLTTNRCCFFYFYFYI